MTFFGAIIIVFVMIFLELWELFFVFLLGLVIFMFFDLWLALAIYLIASFCGLLKKLITITFDIKIKKEREESSIQEEYDEIDNW